MNANVVFCLLTATALVLDHNPDATTLAAPDASQVKMAVFFALIPVVVVFSFVVFVFYRMKREAFFKQAQAELNLKIAQVEIKAIKAQINPHFIFNCMNSIHHYMHKNDVKLAGDYLIKFSQLIRLVLENASLSSVTLKEELEALQLYIQLEQLRLNHSFSYQIKVGDDTPLHGEIPNFLMQPLVENAIWHGLSKVSADGNLFIDLERQGDVLRCVIESSGTGVRQYSGDPGLETMVKKTSMGANLIRERIELLRRTGSASASFEIDDVSKDGGYCYRVILTLPIDLDD